MSGRTQHKVARGEYLFKILRNHDFSEAEAQAAMDLMGKDAKGFGITSGTVHVVYPGDLVTLPGVEEVRQILVAEAAAAEDRTQAILAAEPGTRPMPVVHNLPTVDAEEIQAAVEVLEEGSLDRLGELLALFNQRQRPLPAQSPVSPSVLGPAPAPVVERRAVPPPAPSNPRAAPASPVNLPMQSGPVKVGDLMARFGRPGPSVVRPTAAPRWPATSAMGQLPRYGDPFQYRFLDDFFNLHRPYNADASEAWFHYHRCPNCASGSSGMCILVKLLSTAEYWADVLSAFGASKAADE